MPQLTIQEHFTRGLRPQEKVQVNSPYLEECVNLKATPYGLATPEEILDPATYASSWPFPQFFVGKRISLLPYEGTLYYWDSAARTVTARTVWTIASAITDTLSDETLTNPSFSSDTSWTKGTGWAITGGYATHTASNATTLSQPHADQVSGKELAASKVYRISMTLTTCTAGKVRVGVGTYNTSSMRWGTWRSAAGTYVEHLLTSSDDEPTFYLEADSYFAGSIADVSARPLVVATIEGGGGPWNFIDFGESWFLHNTRNIICAVPFLANGEPVLIKDSTDLLTCRAGCNFNDRLVLGGLDSWLDYGDTNGVFGSDDFKLFWDYWLQSDPLAMTSRNLKMGRNIVFVGMQSGGDFIAPFILELALLNYPARPDLDDELKSNILDAFVKREMFFVPLPWQGDILSLKRLGDGIVAYCTDGISFLRPTQEGGFIPIDVYSVGLAERTAVCGDERGHRFIDTHGNLWALGPDLQLQKLGYKEFLEYFITEQESEATSSVTNGEFAAGTGWTLGTGWAVTGGALVHTPGNTAAATQPVASQPTDYQMVDSAHYVLRFKQRSATAGYVTVSVGAQNIIASWSSSSTKEFFVTFTAGPTPDIAITPTTDYDGQIEYLRINRMRSIMSCYDPEEGDYYFSNGVKGYLLSPSGMTQITELPMSLVRFDDDLLGPHVVASADTTAIRVVTCPFNMDTGEHKIVRVVDMGILTVTDLRAGVDWSNTLTTTFRTLGPYLVNREGLSFPTATARSFKLRFTGVYSVSSLHKVEAVNVLFDVRGKRGLAATYAKSIT